MRTLLLVGVLALAACSAREDEDDDDLDFHATDWSAQLSARPGSAVQGSATLRSMGLDGGSGTGTASVSIGGAQPGARHPWHVHAGTCATGGPIVADADAYPTLEAGADGRASATASIARGFDEEGSYFVNIHRAPNDLQSIVACGDLRD